MSATSRPDEDGLIARWLRPLAGDPAALRLMDDAACLTPPDGHDLVLTKDALATGVHFLAADPWDLVARKALRTNLSDLAAKGARPLGYLLALGLPGDWRIEQMDALAAGLAADQVSFGIALLGGDTIRSPGGLLLSITAIGTVARGRMVRRGGARIGDGLHVSGSIGDAALGLAARRARAGDGPMPDYARDREVADHLIDRYLLPRPRIDLADWLGAHASAGMDLSDGLLIDAGRMARASGVAIEIDLDAVPFSNAARTAMAIDGACRATALTGGDDYEILFCAGTPPPPAPGGVPVTRIGRVIDGPPGLRLTGTDAAALARGGGFRHF